MFILLFQQHHLNLKGNTDYDESNQQKCTTWVNGRRRLIILRLSELYVSLRHSVCSFFLPKTPNSTPTPTPPHPQKKPAQNELQRSMHILNHHHHPQLHTQRHTHTHTHRCTHTHTHRGTHTHTHRGTHTHTAYLFNTGRTPPVPFGHVR